MTLWDPGDPAVEPAAGSHAGPLDDATFTVSELGEAIRAALVGAFPRQVWVRGEIRNISKRAAGGHCYFDLVEPGAAPGSRPEAKLPVALFRAARERVNATLVKSGSTTRMDDGIEIRARAEVDWWVGGGQLRLLMSAIDPVFTLGRLAEERARLLALLRSEGLLDRNAGRPVPALPLRVALLTSAGSAAEADFRHELAASGFRFDVRTIDTRVQGLQAPASVASALDRAARTDCDVVALVRGGGATTDLMAFDSEQVARAVAACPLPVFTGIGHETDHTVADEVCNQAAKTPTACAALLVGRVALADDALSARWADLASRGRRALRHAERAATAAGERLPRVAQAATVRPRAALDAKAARISREAVRQLREHDRSLAHAGAALRTVPVRSLRSADARLLATDATLRALDPVRVLARGWSITHTAGGTLVRDPAQVAVGDTLVTTVAEGSLTSTVVEP